MVDSGKEEYAPGDAFYISAGHDGYVIGYETVVGLDISNADQMQALLIGFVQATGFRADGTQLGL